MPNFRHPVVVAVVVIAIICVLSGGAAAGGHNVHTWISDGITFIKGAAGH